MQKLRKRERISILLCKKTTTSAQVKMTLKIKNLIIWYWDLGESATVLTIKLRIL